ncbi:MAG: PRC-barrel domain-containing protein [Candidatus Diapherotrites archaeon]|nr:PRC-barrel domain-containing protein [Candidatus Diapherotrites archaeon]
MATRKFAIAKQLGGKRVITNKGEEIGRLSDIQFDEHTGVLETFLVEPAEESKTAKNLPRTEDDFVAIPFKAVFAVSDVIVVDETLLK